MITNDNIQVVIGDIASSSVKAMAPIAEKNKVVLLSPGASNPDISKSGDYIFRNFQSDDLEANIIAKFIYSKMNVKEISTLYIQNDYGTGMNESFKKQYLKTNGKILITESYNQNATNMREQISKIKNKKSHSVFIASYPKEAAYVLKQAKELNTGLKFFATHAIEDPEIFTIAGEAANGVIFSAPVLPDINNLNVKNFKDKYFRKYQKLPGVCSDSGYDALKIITLAISQGNSSGERIKDFLYNLKDYNGAAGLTSFDENGDVIKEFTFYQIEGNEFKKLQYEEN
jgi:branched-chain amino acid transport system substrate-binding protein